jgi:L,D-transpeptidase-like protein
MNLNANVLEPDRLFVLKFHGRWKVRESCGLFLKEAPEAMSMSTHHSLVRRHLRQFLSICFLGAAAMFAANGAALAAVQITIDKDNQQMSVAVDGVQRYAWPVSSGIPAHETPNGSFRAFRMEADHFSKEWDDAPMPHSIFFTKVGHAIHGTDSVGKLGSPASHGCVRLSRDHAATLYALVEKEGVLNTTVTLTGSSQVALARNPRGKTTVARGDAPGDPVQIAPRGYNAQGAVRTDDATAEVYVDQYGRPVSVNRNPGYAANPYANRRVYQPGPQYDEADAYGQGYRYARPYQPQPRNQYYYNQ